MSKKAGIVVAVTIIWGLALIMVDRAFNVRPEVAKAGEVMLKPHVEIEIRHLCCTGCNDSAFKALARFSWMGQPKLFKGELPSVDAQKAKGTEAFKGMLAYVGSITAEINPEQLNQVDFVALDRAIRSEGLVPDKMVIKGLPVFSLVAQLPHVCCPACVAALEGTFNPKKAEGDPAAVAFTMLGLAGQPKISEVSKEVEIAFKGQADVVEFMLKLEQGGFAPKSLHVSIPR